MVVRLLPWKGKSSAFTHMQLSSCKTQGDQGGNDLYKVTRKSSNNPRLLTLGPSHSSAPLSNPSQDAGIQATHMFSIFIFIYISPSPSMCSELRQCISYDPNLGEPETSAVWGLEHLSGR